MYCLCQRKQLTVTKIRSSFAGFLNADQKAQTFLSNALGAAVTTQRLDQRGHIFLAITRRDGALEHARN